MRAAHLQLVLMAWSYRQQSRIGDIVPPAPLLILSYLLSRLF
ncbi:MAG: hypothetical protein OJF49_003294 [Ktedonobacterales bacterium]|nr:MAG: hypothetical protein OJF49_003294 [Ktedonobacterales bacterium]